MPGGSAPFALPCAKVSDHPPLAVAGGPIYSGGAGAPVTLDGSGSSDPEGAALTYRWSFGDGTSGTGAAPAHAYPSAGTYMVKLVVNDGVNDSVADIGTRSFAQVVVGAAAAAPPVSGPPAPVPSPAAQSSAISADAACADDQLRLTDVFPSHGRVQLRGVAPAATRGESVAISFGSPPKRVATATVGADLSFAATAPLPARRLRTSNRARYTAAIGSRRSPALKLARRAFLLTVARTATRLIVTGQIVKPLARARTDRRVLLRIATTCSNASSAGRTVGAFPKASGAFRFTVALTAKERSAAALYVRAGAKVRSNARSRGTTRTFTLPRGVVLSPRGDRRRLLERARSSA
jgi:hypothetical protein